MPRTALGEVTCTRFASDLLVLASRNWRGMRVALQRVVLEHQSNGPLCCTPVVLRAHVRYSVFLEAAAPVEAHSCPPPLCRVMSFHFPRPPRLPRPRHRCDMLRLLVASSGIFARWHLVDGYGTVTVEQ